VNVPPETTREELYDDCRNNFIAFSASDFCVVIVVVVVVFKSMQNFVTE
jgi:hypothetical protein